MIVVFGASGYTGLEVIRSLVRRGAPVRGFVRNPATVAAVREAGASEMTIGELRDLDAVAAAIVGASGVFFIGPRFMPEEAALGAAVVDLAARARVRRFVFSGVYHPTILELLNHRAKVHIESRLYRSDLEFTVLQPARFMHGLILSSRQRILDPGVLADAFSPEVKMAYVDYRDVAEVASIAFTEDRLVRGTFELSAPGQLTLHEFATAVGAAIGATVRAEQTPLERYAPAAVLMNHPYSADGFQRLRRFYDEFGFPGGNSLVLEKILGRPARDVESCARALLVEAGAGRSAAAETQ